MQAKGCWDSCDPGTACDAPWTAQWTFNDKCYLFTRLAQAVGRQWVASSSTAMLLLCWGSVPLGQGVSHSWPQQQIRGVFQIFGVIVAATARPMARWGQHG